MEYTSIPTTMIFQGQAVIPSKFIVSYRNEFADGTADVPTITFIGIAEASGEEVELNQAYSLSHTGGKYGSAVIDVAYVPLSAMFYKITNHENLGEIASIIMQTRGLETIRMEA